MSDLNTGPGGPETGENGTPSTTTADADNSAPDGPGDGNADESADTFPRDYVETLRKESADHRTKAKAAEDRADTLAKRLHTELVRVTGKLENAADLPFDAEHLDDDDKLSAAIDALLEDRPYFAKRKVSGDAGQGPRGGNKPAPSFGDLFRSA